MAPTIEARRYAACMARICAGFGKVEWVRSSASGRGLDGAALEEVGQRMSHFEWRKTADLPIRQSPKWDRNPVVPRAAFGGVAKRRWRPGLLPVRFARPEPRQRDRLPLPPPHSGGREGDRGRGRSVWTVARAGCSTGRSRHRASGCRWRWRGQLGSPHSHPKRAERQAAHPCAGSQEGRGATRDKEKADSDELQLIAVRARHDQKSRTAACPAASWVANSNDDSLTRAWISVSVARPSLKHQTRMRLVKRFISALRTCVVRCSHGRP